LYKKYKKAVGYVQNAEIKSETSYLRIGNSRKSLNSELWFDMKSCEVITMHIKGLEELW